MKKSNKREQGRKNRQRGKLFEIRVRADLELKGYTVDRWTNNIDLEKNKIVPAKPKMIYNPIIKRMITQQNNSGFPDFVCYNLKKNEVIGVECKSNGCLDRIEKDKIKWLINHKTFSKVLMAVKTKVKNKVWIKYKEIKFSSYDGKIKMNFLDLLDEGYIKYNKYTK